MVRHSLTTGAVHKTKRTPAIPPPRNSLAFSDFSLVPVIEKKSNLTLCPRSRHQINLAAMRSKTNFENFQSAGGNAVGRIRIRRVVWTCRLSRSYWTNISRISGRSKSVTPCCFLPNKNKSSFRPAGQAKPLGH